MDNPAKDPAGNEKVGGKLGKKGMLNGKNKWYIVGGLGIVAVLVFFFVSRSNSSASPAATTTAGTGDPSTNPATDGSQLAATGPPGQTGATGPAGPKGARGPRGRRGKKAPVHHKSKPTPMKRAGVAEFTTVRPGDTLGSIASRYSVPGGGQALYHQNRAVVGSSTNIHPGQRLKI